ncbi:MAG: nicotinate-nucleotide adenylyltransferase [Rhodocyclaceae bacterium]|jgi:nicotinate-nucleotide adenylyltransferase|nr:nicotinate-nucleotide adenylyltransferase [Rhodocyclaceae bacterium]
MSGPVGSAGNDAVGTVRNDAVGIMGGTFDPVHLAHLALARTALDRLGLAEVRWIPAGRPWHRDAPGASPADRVAMVRAAIAGEPRFVLDASEAEAGAPGYTVDTLARLRRELGPDRPIVLLLGADAFRGLAGWHRWRELFDLAHIAVATRPGFPLDEVPAPLDAEFAARRLHVGGGPALRRPASADFSGRPAGNIHAFELVAGTVSATEARTLLAAGAADDQLRGLLPAPVLDYIRRNRLYSR